VASVFAVLVRGDGLVSHGVVVVNQEIRDTLLGGFGFRVQAMPVVALVVHLPVVGEREDEVLAAPNPKTLDLSVTGFSEDAHACEGILVQFVQTLVHAFDQVFDLEGQPQVLGELVLAHPDGVVLLVQILPEVGDGFGLDVFVGIDALELVEDEAGLGESGEGILLFLGRRFFRQPERLL